MVCRTSAPTGLWSPFRDLVRLQTDFGRLFGEPLRTQKVPEGPAFNVWKNEHGMVVTSEVPGMDAAKLEISVVGDTVTIQGQKATDDYAEDTRVQRRERSLGQFNRTLKLPYRIDASRTEAVYRNGVLSVTLPAMEDDKRKQITVKSA